MKSLINYLHKSLFLSKVFPTLNFLLQRELKNCSSVLDLGCGPSSPISRCTNIKYSVGVEIHEPYFNCAVENKTHSKLIRGDISNMNFDENSFDATVLIDVLEHLDRQSAIEILDKAKKWSRKMVVVNTPNGFVEQPSLDNNPHQKHISGWGCSEMRDLNFKTFGLAGLKCLRKPKQETDSMDDDLTVSMRYKPKAFWFGVATLSQTFTYFFPKYAFELFCVEDLHS